MLPIDLLSRLLLPNPFLAEALLPIGRLLFLVLSPNLLISLSGVKALLRKSWKPELLTLSVGEELLLCLGGELLPISWGDLPPKSARVLSRLGALFENILRFWAGLSMVICPLSLWWQVEGPHVLPFTPSAGTEIANLILQMWSYLQFCCFTFPLC